MTPFERFPEIKPPRRNISSVKSHPPHGGHSRDAALVLVRVAKKGTAVPRWGMEFWGLATDQSYLSASIAGTFQLAAGIADWARRFSGKDTSEEQRHVGNTYR